MLLLSGDAKRNRRILGPVAGLVLFMRLADLFWLIVPAHDDPHDPAGPMVHWADFLLCAAAVIGLGGLWLAFFLWQLGRRPLLPPYDPALLEAGHG